MNVLFVHTFFSPYEKVSSSKPLRTPETIQFGISYISSYLKLHGHNTRLLVLSRSSGEENFEILERFLAEFSPSLVCFTSVSTEFGFVSKIARYIKNRHPLIYTLIGGPHVSLDPRNVSDVFDAVCIGEGEKPALELVRQLQTGKKPTGIANLWINNKTTIERNPTGSFMDDLDSLPFPDRQMWEEWTQQSASPRYSVLLGRGCPFECTYCCNHALKKLASGPYTRTRSTGNILKEIEAIAKNFTSNREIYLEVETICTHKEWVLELCVKLGDFNKGRRFPVSFGTNVRITSNIQLREIFAAFKKSNFRFVNFGLESGSQRLRRQVLRRNYSNEDVIKTVRLAREFGLQISFNNMLGFPSETISDFKDTLEINRICQPDWMGVFIFYPYPGTDLYSLSKEQGLLKGTLETEMERGRAILDIPTFPKKKIENSYVWFEYNVYKGHRSTIKLLLNVLILKMRTRKNFFRVYCFLKDIHRLLKKVLGFAQPDS